MKKSAYVSVPVNDRRPDIVLASQSPRRQELLRRTLQTIGRLSLDDLDKEPIVLSPSLYFYRNKMEYAFGGVPNNIYVALRERASPLKRYKKGTVALRVSSIFSRTAEPSDFLFHVVWNHVTLSLTTTPPAAKK